MCRHQARRFSLDKAQRKYRQTDRGKETHRLSERRRRLGKAKSREEKSVDDQGSIRGSSSVKVGLKLISGAVRCLFCQVIGQVVQEFPRRGYGI